MRIEQHYTQALELAQVSGSFVAQYDDATILAFQAYDKKIADWAIEHGHLGGPSYDLGRMTWIKTSFLWMMHRSNWGTSPRQERILALTLDRKYFDGLLTTAVSSRVSGALRLMGRSGARHARPEVISQMDPDRTLDGSRCERRAVQIGLRGRALRTLAGSAIMGLEDITAFVRQQHCNVTATPQREVLLPVQRYYL